MQVKQKFSLLFYLKRSKRNQEGCPLYVRITIDGLKDEISLQLRIQPKDWDMATKTVLPGCPGHHAMNDKIAAARVDIKRHFDLIQLTKGIAIPEAVKAAYLSPVKGSLIQEQKTEYHAFQENLVGLMTGYVKWCKTWRKIKDRVAELPEPKKAQLAKETAAYRQKIEQLDKQAFRIYGDKAREKTLSPEHITKGGDGALWIDIARLKTSSDEPVPLLPPAIEIMEKFKNHPQFKRKHRILPMPSNEHWNRCQKEMADELGFEIDMHGHQTRYFFINELTYDNDMSLPAIKPPAKIMSGVSHAWVTLRCYEQLAVDWQNQ